MTAVNPPRWARSAAALALAGLLVGCSPGAVEPPPTPETPEEPALADGDYFAYITVGRDQSDEITLAVDLAEMLTGEEARQAAIDAGVIEEGEELPNDFFIDNPEIVMELIHLADDVEITVISGTDTSEQILIDGATLERLYEGTYSGDPIYGIPAGVPIVMDIVVEDGLITEAHAVYLP